ncbi:short chain dehydrogenase [Mycobacterium sp. THAF192]|nr:short chain dehydrogenase [Mycobacterium sp. THAF192]
MHTTPRTAIIGAGISGLTTAKNLSDAGVPPRIASAPCAVLVDNAGIGSTPATLVDTDVDEWHRVLSVNLDGTFFGIKVVAPSIVRVAAAR